MDLSKRGVVIFDFDGTIADTLPMIVETARVVLREHGVAEEELVRAPELVGPPFPQAFSLVFGLSDEEAREVTRDYRERYARLGPAGWPLIEGMGELVADLDAAGRRLGVASSKRMRFVRQGLSDQGILERFDVVVGKRSDDEMSKAAAIREVVESLGATTEDAVMIGDRRFDVEAAREAGVPCVGGLFGGTADRSELEGAGACAVAEKVDDLRSILLGPRT